MATSRLIAARVSAEAKHRFRALAEQRCTTPSALLKSLVEAAVGPFVPHATQLETATRPVRSSRLYVRIKPEDRLLLNERAAARRMAPATYVSAIVRSHLRSVCPVPKDELTALTRLIGELNAIGRNLNQLTRVVHERGATAGMKSADLQLFIKVCEGLRCNVKQLLNSNMSSWVTGHVDDRT